MNPMSMALKARRSESAKSKIEPMHGGENAHADPVEKIKMLISQLSPEQKQECQELLSGTPESESEEMSEGESKPTDSSGQLKMSQGELAELQAEGANILKGHQGAESDDDEQMGGRPMGLMDRFNKSIGKHFKK